MKAPVFPSTHVAVDVEPLKLNVIFGGSNNTLKLPVLQLPVFPAASLTNPYQVTPLDAPCSLDAELFYVAELLVFKP